MRTSTLLLAFALALSLAACKSASRTCDKMKSLCNVELDTCTGTRDSVKENFGPEALDKFDACYLEAASCSEANGCVAGAAINATTDAAKGFLKGLEKELDKKK
jgi:hypothetical protein